MKAMAPHSLVPLSVFFGVVYLLTVLSVPTSAASVFPNPLSKYSFTEVSNCKGMYDMRIYARLNSICNDCYNLFRDPEIHTLCRKNCFTSKYFKGCLEVLLIKDVKQLEEITKDISAIHPMETGAD